MAPPPSRVEAFPLSATGSFPLEFRGFHFAELMDLDAFRRHGHALVDWMADYLRDLPQAQVVPDVEPGEIRAQLPSAPPEQGEAFPAILSDFHRIVYPGITHWGHPAFFGYFPANHSPPSILAEMLTATLGAQSMSWQTSPAATELEQVVMEWLRQMIGLPAGFTGVIQDYASTSTLVALITARDRAAAPMDRAVLYTSGEAHSSVPKGGRLAGFRSDLIRAVPADDAFAMRPDELARMIRADREAGLIPVAVVATVGTTSSTGIDPVRAIGEVAAREGLWYHVDAAFGGSAMVCPENRWMFDGIELADSLVFNPHKWLLVNFDCSAYFVRDSATLLRSFSTSPEYLKTTHDAKVVNYRDWGIPLGRRFRALKLWFVIRSYGIEGLQAMIREHIRLGNLFAGWVESHPEFEILAPHPLALVCFRWKPSGKSEAELNELNRLLLERINRTGRVFLTHTLLRGRYTIRLALGHLTTTEAHVRETWDIVLRSAAELA